MAPLPRKVNEGRNAFGGVLPDPNEFHPCPKDRLPLSPGRSHALTGGGVDRPDQQSHLKALCRKGETIDPAAPCRLGVFDEGTRGTDIQENGVLELELGGGSIRQADPFRPTPVGDGRG